MIDLWRIKSPDGHLLLFVSLRSQTRESLQSSPHMPALLYATRAGSSVKDLLHMSHSNADVKVVFHLITLPFPRQVDCF